MEEIWREIPGFPGYEVSNQGQVRSYFRRTGKKWGIADSPQRILRPTQHSKYRGVCLGRNGKRHYRRIGRLILLAFVGLPPDGMEMCHNDGNSTNDHLMNLRWDTHPENMQDASNHGTMTGKGKPKLGQEKVCKIRNRFASGRYSRMELAKEFGVSISTIKCVLNRRDAYEGGAGPIRKPRPYTQLTDQQVEAIRKQRASGEALAVLAEKYGVSESAISLIASGKRHSNVAGPRIRRYEIICRS